ncbi:MAG: DUF58 domain-containing protein, partial [Acidobacteria bacterium]|nr:DUF58 domain-containing protein [Acidobacteriota bacterium]
RSFPARLYVRNSKFWMPSFSIQTAGGNIAGAPVYFPAIPGGAVMEEQVEIRFNRRGAYGRSSVSFHTSFPFGFLEKASGVTLEREVLVYPSLEPKPGFEHLLAGLAGEIETHYQGLGRDFYRIRPYQTFESARHLDWKATARTGEFQVREFAREQERTVEIYFDAAVPAGAETRFEEAVDCCAFLAWRLTQMGMGIRFRSGHFAVRVPEETGVYTILKFLALVSPQKGKWAPTPPVDESSFQIVLTTAPERFENLDWVPDHVLDPGQFTERATDGGGSGARSD